MPGVSSAIAEAKKSKYSTIVGTELSDDDVCRIWENVSAFVDKQMSQNKGVTIPGLGTFAFTQKNLEVGNNKVLLIQRPVFMVSEKFAQTHQLQCTKHHVTGQVPIVPLNFAYLANESPFNRDIVEGCVKEVIQALSRSVAVKKNVEFTFQGIGRLQIRDNKVKLKFYKEFLNSMDGSGQLVNALKDRPGTVDSVMSERAPTRAHSSNTVLFPRLQSRMDAPGAGGANDQMPTINEEGTTEYPQQSDDYYRDRALEDELNTFDPDYKDDLERPQSKAPSRVAVPLATATGISFQDDLLPRAFSTTPKVRRSLSPLNGLLTPRPPSFMDRARTMDDIMLKRPTPLPKVPTPPLEKRTASADSACGHVNAGQELCYLCHQRSRRNIPVSFTEERKRRENEEDKLLQQYNHMKDTEHIINEHEKTQAKRHDLQKMAAFNLGVADAVKQRKIARETDFFPSYVFQRRPLTPPRIFKQEKYFNDLKSQTDLKEEKLKRSKADEGFLERLEQVQLAEDLAMQREEYVKGKAEQTDMYKKALDAQMRYKPLPMPARVPDSEGPVFGKNDLNMEKIIERRRLAHGIYQEQLNTVEQKKRAAILNRLNEQKDDENMIKRSKQDLLEDRAFRYEKIVRNRKTLEDNWTRALEQKKRREADEKRRMQSPDHLMHEMCDKYKRCGQCRKRLNNCGESNIWRDTQYIPGSTIMV